LNAITQQESVSTGIQGFDEILCGGIPRGSFVVIAGHPGSGKTTLAAHFIEAGLRRGEKAVYISLSERVEEFLEHMENVGIDLASYKGRGSSNTIGFPWPRMQGFWQTKLSR
jgi:KaiC/GvpD/RAD55 family RecA-like ATPase